MSSRAVPPLQRDRSEWLDQTIPRLASQGFRGRLGDLGSNSPCDHRIGSVFGRRGEESRRGKGLDARDAKAQGSFTALPGLDLPGSSHVHWDVPNTVQAPPRGKPGHTVRWTLHLLLDSEACQVELPLVQSNAKSKFIGYLSSFPAQCRLLHLM